MTLGSTVDDQEYRAFLRHLFDSYIAPRAQFLSRSFEGPGRDDFASRMARLRTAKLLANYARQCETDEQIYSTFKMEFLSSTISETAAAVKHVSTIAHETGFAQAV